MSKQKKSRPTSPTDIKQFEPPKESYAIESPSKRCRATLAELRKCPGDATAYAFAAGELCFNTHTTKRYAERAVWLWSQLESAIRARSLVIETGDETKIAGHGVDCGILLRESSNVYYERQKDYWGRDRDYDRQRHVHNGFFKFELGRVWELGHQKSWGDTKGTALDSRIEEIADFFVTALPKIRDQREEWARKNREREEQRQTAAVERELARIEGEKRAALVSLATNYRSSEAITDLLASIRKEAGEELSERMSEWLSWAESAAREINPTSRIIRMLAEGQNPSMPTLSSWQRQ